MLLLLAYRLSSRFCRTIGFSTFNAAMLTAALFLFNTALLRTILLNQVNLWLLILVFLTFLYSTKNPVIAGLSISFAFHIKLYPAALLIPLLFMKCYRTVLWAGLGILGIFLLQTNFGSTPEVWVQFLRFAPFFPRGTAFRDNSIHSFVLNSLGLSNLMDVNTREFYTAIQIVVLVLNALLLFWFVKRFRKREAFFRIRVAEKGTDRPALRRLFGHMNDALAATLLLSPLVWDHHYIILLPMIICGFKWAPPHIKWKIAVASFLILTLPVFDIYPFSYHRLVGLLALVYWMDPVKFSIEQDQPHTSVAVKDPS